ncbi:MAG: NADH-quinone oxidoreductase subunit N [Acidimicrobiaceae bacterium]|jgi:NADH-quinone oxidoreductase subunit N|nr:NADH-quinone oxidoreductase subunit N [Ilumatobacteraceae bacterium]
MFAAGLSAPDIQWAQLVPLLVLLGGACVLLLSTLAGSLPRWVAPSLTIATTFAALVVSAVRWNELYYNKGSYLVADAIAEDRFSMFATIVILVAVVCAALLMSSHHDNANGDALENYALLLTSAIGAIVMVAANNLIVMFLGLEILSLSLYLMAASDRRREQSQEAGLKYFILGGFASAFLLYGIALVYGATGAISISGISERLAGELTTGNKDALLLIGIGLILVGLGFKVSAAPFQVWTPDVYEGAPTSVTSYMASAGKVAAFAALLRLFMSGLTTRVDDWRPVIWVLAALTIFVGSTMAVVQTNVKRMLAYSSISHAGFVLVGVEAASHRGSDGLASSMAYLAIYTMLVMGSFAILVTVAGQEDSATSLDSFKGLAQRRPILALAFSALLFAQAGVPFTSGFVAKFGVIKSAVEAESYAIAVVAMVGAVIGAFLYLRIMVSMWMEDPTNTEKVTIPRPAGVVIAASVAFALIVGFFPGLLLDAAKLVRFVPL